MAEPLLTLADICARYVVSNRRARDIVRQHAVPVLQPGRQWLFDTRAETAFREALYGYKRHTREQIIAGAIPFRHSAVYFLITRDEVVYVGRAVHVFRRLTQHLTRISFDRYYAISCPPEHLAEVEAFYISLLQPAYNKVGGERQRVSEHDA